MKILMAIKPEFGEKILNKTKRFEFRKGKCKQRATSIVLYETVPVAKVTGEVFIKGILTGTPESIWSRTKEAAGITKEFFDSYYEGKSLAVAYEIGRVKRFLKPRTLSDYGVSKAPQSIVYIKE